MMFGKVVAGSLMGIEDKEVYRYPVLVNVRCDPDDGSLHDELLYYDETEPDALFYELHRLQDIEPGTYFIEDYYGSFDNY